ncbi:MAG: M81 family metallopeptidase [Pseudomonadales bacterium]
MNIAIASFQHETNTFSPQVTTYDEFVVADGWPGMLRGPEVLRELEGLNIAAAGFIAAAREAGHTLLPINWCSAEPAGLVCRDAFDQIIEEIVTALQEIKALDAVFLDLHGAMVSEDFSDGELEIVRRVKAVLAPNIPVVAALDFHANLSANFVAAIDSFAVYRTYPHVDMAETGKRTLLQLAQLQRNGKLYRSFVNVPYLIPLSSQHTGSEPLQGLFQLLGQLEQLPGIEHIEFALGFPPADVFDSGASISVFGGDKALVEQVCQRFYEAVLEAEQRFPELLLSTEQALEFVRTQAQKFPVVIADVQDNPGAGGSADTTGILRDLAQAGASSVLLAALCDAEAVVRAQQVGEGGKMHLHLGGSSLREDLVSFGGEFEVLALGDGHFRCSGAMYAGCEVSLGPLARLKLCNTDADIQVIVSSVRYACTDLAIYPHLGVDPLDFELLVVKSTVHFRAAFEPICEHILYVESPGLHPCRLDGLVYQQLRSAVRLGPGGPSYD